MAELPPQVFNVTKLVGIPGGTPDSATNATNLMNAIMKTVSPSSWFAMGGHGAIQATFNQTSKQWFLMVHADDAQIFSTIKTLLADLSASAPP